MSFFKISLENNKNLFERYNIYSVPTIIITNELKEIKRVAGVLSYNDLVKFINDLNY
jgi:thioredoxin-related protein